VERGTPPETCLKEEKKRLTSFTGNRHERRTSPAAFALIEISPAPLGTRRGKQKKRWEGSSVLLAPSAGEEDVLAGKDTERPDERKKGEKFQGRVGLLLLRFGPRLRYQGWWGKCQNCEEGVKGGNGGKSRWDFERGGKGMALGWGRVLLVRTGGDDKPSL